MLYNPVSYDNNILYDDFKAMYVYDVSNIKQALALENINEEEAHNIIENICYIQIEHALDTNILKAHGLDINKHMDIMYLVEIFKQDFASLFEDDSLNTKLKDIILKEPMFILNILLDIDLFLESFSDKDSFEFNLYNAVRFNWVDNDLFLRVY